MASGDTKTESLLNILGNGGSTAGITGSGNTKTQNYLIDAIERLNGIENRLDNLTIMTISQADYDNLDPKDPNTLYLITGD